MKIKILDVLALLTMFSTSVFAGPPNQQIGESKPKKLITGSATVDKTGRPKAGDKPLSIERSDAISGGTFLRIDWSPSAAVGAFVVLSEEEIEVGYDDSGFLKTYGEPIYKTFREADEVPEVVFNNLNPSKKYFYAILPMNDPGLGNGLVIPHYRTAKTLNRGVSVKAAKIHLIDDSDDFSDGDVAFSFQLLPPDIHPKDADPAILHDAKRWPALSGNEQVGEGYMTLCSGATANPNVVLKAFGVGDEIGYAVSCYDDDVDGVYDVSHMPTETEYTGAFNVDHGEANSGFWTLDIDGGTFETDTDDDEDYESMEQFSRLVVKEVSENDITCLEYKAYLIVSVFYFAD